MFAIFCRTIINRIDFAKAACKILFSFATVTSWVLLHPLARDLYSFSQDPWSSFNKCRLLQNVFSLLCKSQQGVSPVPFERWKGLKLPKELPKLHVHLPQLQTFSCKVLIFLGFFLPLFEIYLYITQQSKAILRLQTTKSRHQCSITWSVCIIKSQRICDWICPHSFLMCLLFLLLCYFTFCFCSVKWSRKTARDFIKQETKSVCPATSCNSFQERPKSTIYQDSIGIKDHSYQTSSETKPIFTKKQISSQTQKGNHGKNLNIQTCSSEGLFQIVFKKEINHVFQSNGKQNNLKTSFYCF